MTTGTTTAPTDAPISGHSITFEQLVEAAQEAVRDKSVSRKALGGLIMIICESLPRALSAARAEMRERAAQECCNLGLDIAPARIRALPLDPTEREGEK